MRIPYMQFYIDDYLGDTQHLTTEQHGAYFLILISMWKNGGYLPNDEKKLSRITRVNLRRWHLICDDIMEFFKVENGRIFQPRLIEEHKKAVSKFEKRSASGSLGGKAKSLKNSVEEHKNVDPKVEKRSAFKTLEKNDKLLKNKETALANAKQMLEQPEPEPYISLSFANAQERETRDALNFSISKIPDLVQDLGNPTEALPPHEPQPPPEPEGCQDLGACGKPASLPAILGKRAQAAAFELEFEAVREPPRSSRITGHVEDLGDKSAPAEFEAKPQRQPAKRSSDKAARKREIEREFEEIFWPKVVKKLAKADAVKAWAKARSKASLETIMDGLERYQASKQGEDIKFWVYPATFLNKERWADEPAPIKEKEHENSNSGRFPDKRSQGQRFTDALRKLGAQLEAKRSGQEAGEYVSCDF